MNKAKVSNKIARLRRRKEMASGIWTSAKDVLEDAYTALEIAKEQEAKANDAFGKAFYDYKDACEAEGVTP